MLKHSIKYKNITNEIALILYPSLLFAQHVETALFRIWTTLNYFFFNCPRKKHTKYSVGELIGSCIFSRLAKTNFMNST